MTEHVILFKKGKSQPQANLGCPPEWYQPVWDIAPVPPRSVRHPAPFPEDLPHRLIRLFTNEGDVVLDPFNGAGSTTKAAFDLNRRAVGFDIEEKYIEIAKRRIMKGSGVRSKQLVVAPINRESFVPGKPRGKTRHGAGIGTRTTKP